MPKLYNFSIGTERPVCEVPTTPPFGGREARGTPGDPPNVLLPVGVILV